MPDAAVKIKKIVTSIVIVICAVCVPPASIKARTDQMEINRHAVLVSTILLFIARALQFQQSNDLLNSFLISAGFFVLIYIFNYLAKKIARLTSQRRNVRSDTAQKWVTYLVAIWTISLFVTIIDSASNIIFGTPTIPAFLLGAGIAALAISIGAVAIVLLKTKFYDHKRIGKMYQVGSYLLVGLVINSAMLYFFVYLTW